MDKIKHISLGLILIILTFIIIGIIVPLNEWDLGNGYWYDQEGKRLFGPDMDIPPRAEIIKNNGDVIIVEQQPKIEKEEATYGREYIYPYGRDTTYYWVVYKKKHTFIGPLMWTQLDSIITSEKINHL